MKEPLVPQIEDGPIHQQTRLIPLTRWNNYHPFPTTAALRWMRFNGEKNGFNSCTLKVGKRVLIDEAKFFKWMREYGQEGV